VPISLWIALRVSSDADDSVQSTVAMIGTRRPPDQALVSKDDVGDQDRGDLPGLAQPSGTPALRMSSMIRSRRFK
jgi:hypothetical protein